MLHRDGRRAGFTMIELLMVVAIIAILVALFMGAVTKVMGVMQRTEVMSDITQMAQSLEAAKSGYQTKAGINFLPSRLVLYNTIGKYRDTTGMTAKDAADAKQTANVFRQMFGPRFISKGSTVNWGVADGTVLKGSECLVFYLGGMPVGGKCTGFSTNPTDPTASSVDRYGPFYQFKAYRLAFGPSGKFFRYLDPYGTPFAYFGAYSANEYAPSPIYSGSNDDNSDLSMTDAYNEGVVGSVKKWLNPNSYQIVSGGKDKNLGTVALISVSNGTSDDPTKDNLANFSQTELGNPIE